MSTPLIETRNLKKHFKVGSGLLHAVDGVNLKIAQGKTLGVVGESGCGKSTLGRLCLRLLESTDGEMLFKGENILDYDKPRLRGLRREMQMIFQDPYSSINPRMSISSIIMEPMKSNSLYSGSREMKEKALELMDTVGLSHRLEDAYPHELDGGRRQRVGVARALAVNPEFIVCDEPVSALDVSIQAQILNLLMDLQDQLGLTYMFITHDLSVVKHISDEIAVMYLGQCIERAPVEELFAHPTHPYTQALLEAIPKPEVTVGRRRRKTIKGEVTSPINPPEGCRFESRCPHRCDGCQSGQTLTEISPDHFVACQLTAK